jgi:hypothetical protein
MVFNSLLPAGWTTENCTCHVPKHITRIRQKTKFVCDQYAHQHWPLGSRYIRAGYGASKRGHSVCACRTGTYDCAADRGPEGCMT